jgi:dienelactone hydrolase
MKRIPVLLLVLTLAGCSSAPSGKAVQGASDQAQVPMPTQAATVVAVSTMKVNLTTSDAVYLKATYYPPKNSTVRADALLLLHEAYDDSRSWDSFGRVAQERGYAVFALDLRGHGQSGGEKTFDRTMDNDVDAALAWLKASPAVNSNRIGIVGASLGANLALRGGARYPEIKSVILLSPGMLLWQIGIAEAIVDYGPRPLLLVASKEDTYPAGTVQTLNEQALGYHRLQIYPGAEHGTKMMMPHPDLTPLMLDWFQKTIQ